MSGISLQELFDAGSHLGHPAQKWHPKMKRWIYGEQDGIHLFDLALTAEQLEKAQKRVKELKENGKSLVVVATKKQAAEIVSGLAEETGVMYIINRWPGGLITNWDQVRKSIRRMNEIEEGLKTEKFKENTKYERMLLEKELNRLKRLFGGLRDLRERPDALFIVDAMKEKNAVHEAIKENVEIIALVDSNTNPTGISLPIPANDDALSSIKLIVSLVLDATRKNAEPEEEKPAAKEEKGEEEPKKAVPTAVDEVVAQSAAEKKVKSAKAKPVAKNKEK